MKSFFFELLIMIIFSYTITNLLILIYNDIKNSKVSFIKYVKLLFKSVILIDDELDRSISIFKSLDKIEINSKTVQSGRHHLVKANEYLIEVYKGILDGDKIEAEEYFNRSKYYFENYIKLRYKNRRSIRKL